MQAMDSLDFLRQCKAIPIEPLQDALEAAAETPDWMLACRAFLAATADAIRAGVFGKFKREN